MDASDQAGPDLSDGKYSDDELRKASQQFTLTELARDDGLMPVYRRELRKAEDFEGALRDMPLVVIWGEHITDGGRAFSISINPILVQLALLKLMHPDDPLFDEVVDLVIADLSATTRSALTSTMIKTGQSAEDICNSL